MKYFLVDENNEFFDSVEVSFLSDLPNQRVLVEDQHGNTLVIAKKNLLAFSDKESNKVI